MKILILGSSGQLGRCLYDQFLNSKFDPLYASSNLINLKEIASLRKKIVDLKPDVIINAAAYTKVDEAEDNYDLADLINNRAVYEISRASEEISSWLIHISTDYVFDGIKGDYSENDQTNPINKYGLAKLYGERNLLDTSYSCLIIRTAWLFSRYKNNFLEKIILKIINNNNLTGAYDCIGSPTSASSLAKAIIKIIPKYLNDLSLGGIYHFANQGTASRYELIQEIQNLFIQTSSVKYSHQEIIKVKNSFFNLPANRPLNTSLNSDKIFSTFNIKPSQWKEELKKEIIDREEI